MDLLDIFFTYAEKPERSTNTQRSECALSLGSSGDTVKHLLLAIGFLFASTS